jgi:hypothetical protein
VDAALINPNATKNLGKAGYALVKMKYDSNVLAGAIKNLYEELIEEKR